MHAVLGMPTAPEIRPSGHCFSPFECEFWKRCTANKPSDWIFYLPRLNATTFTELDGNGIESMRDIPSDFPSPPRSNGLWMPWSLVKSISRTI